MVESIIRLVMVPLLKKRLEAIASQPEDEEQAKKSAAIIKHHTEILDSKVRALCKVEPSHPWCKDGKQLVKAKWR